MNFIAYTTKLMYSPLTFINYINYPRTTPCFSIHHHRIKLIHFYSKGIFPTIIKWLIISYHWIWKFQHFNAHHNNIPAYISYMYTRVYLSSYLRMHKLCFCILVSNNPPFDFHVSTLLRYFYSLMHNFYKKWKVGRLWFLKLKCKKSSS